MAVETITHDDVIEEEPEDFDDVEDDSEADQYEFEYQEKIIIPSPKVSIDENDIPIIVNNKTSFEEKILQASPDANVVVELLPCDICARKFNPKALERHIKICEKVQSKPKKIFDAVNKLWKNESDIEKTPATPKSAPKKKKPTKKNPEDNYRTCDYCRRKFCDNAFDRHVEFCREKSTRISSSPVKDVVGQAKLIARTKYNPKEAKLSGRKTSTSPSRKESLVSLISEFSLPPWSGSGRNTPSYGGNLRPNKKRSSSSTNFLSGTKSLGRSAGLQYLRQGDAGRNAEYGEDEEDWNPEVDAKASTLSRDNSGRGSIRRPALTKAALLRFNSGEKKADDVEKKRINNEFGSANNNHNNSRNNNLDYLRTKSVTPSSQLMTRSAYDYKSSYARGDARKAQTPQLSRRSSSRSGNMVGRESASPYSWNSFKPVSSFNMMTSARAEPDGIENDEDMKRKDSLEGEYDHSKEYDPFQTAERQMQELLFGTSSQNNNSAPVPPSSSNYSVQKPQPVRPSATSAFSAYKPHGRLASPTKQQNYSGYSGLDNLRSRTNYLTNLGSDDSNNYTEYSNPPSKVSGGGGSLQRSNSLRSTNTSNWKNLFPSLTRTPSNLQQQNIDSRMGGSSANSLARFCHECGAPFPGAQVRFCPECGVRRLFV